MKILIDDGMQVKIGTGIGKYTSYLYKELKDNVDNNDVVDLEQFNTGNSSKKASRLKYLFHINSYSYQKKCKSYDVVHFTNYAMPFFKCKNTKYVVTIHDLASFAHPETFSSLYKIYNQFIVKLAIKNADAIFTVSNSIKQEISSKWPKVKNKIFVAYPGLYSEYDNEKIKIKFDSDILNKSELKDFFLFSGTLEKRKNLKIVIEAFAKIKKSDNNFKLVLAGRPGFGFDEYKELINKFNIENDVVITGYISSSDLLKLYKEASAYVFPSIYEGFGSTQLECIANNLPIILSDIPTNREVSEGYGLFFKLGDVNSLVEKMLKIVNREIDDFDLNNEAKRILPKYVWSNLIQDYITLYRNLLNNCRG